METKKYSMSKTLKSLEEEKPTLKQVHERYFKISDYTQIVSNSKTNKSEFEIIHEKMNKLLSDSLALPLKLLVGEPNYYHYAYADNVWDMISDHKKECDCEVKILKNRNSTGPITSLFIDDNPKIDKGLIKNLGIIFDGPPTTVKFAKLQIKDRKLRTEKLFSKTGQLQKYDSYSFEVGVPPGYEDQSRSKEKPMFSTCSSCNFINEYIDYDPEYKCLKCRNGW